MNIRQTSLYAQYMQKIGWQAEQIGETYVYVKRFPFIGAFIKIQRPDTLPSYKQVVDLCNKYHARSATLEPIHAVIESDYPHIKHLKDPYIHTKTIHIDLTTSETTIFKRFTSAKRRAVRRAQKLGVATNISQNIDMFVKLKNSVNGLFLGFLTTRVTLPLWNTFAPNHACVLLASLPDTKHGKRKTVAGILMFLVDDTAYYWMAATIREGKKSYAPTLLVWEALKYAKQKGCTLFDFEGIYDDRSGYQNKNWRGFSKFKQGFGGKEVNYPLPVEIRI